MAAIISTVMTLLKSRLWYGIRAKLVLSKYDIGHAQLHDKTKILGKVNQMPSTGLAGVADTKVGIDEQIPVLLYTTHFKAGYNNVHTIINTIPE